VQYDGNGLLTFYPVTSAHVTFFFTNRAASAGRTLRINSDQTVSSYAFGVAGIGYADLHTVFGADIPAGVSSYATPDGLVTLRAYADTPGTTPANFNLTMNGPWDWVGIAGTNNQTIDGAESLGMQFASTVGLSALGTRYVVGNVILSGFTSNPGLVDATGAPISGSTYSGGTLTFHANSWHASEVLVRFTNIGASAGQTLSLHTDANPGAAITLTQVKYAVPPVVVSIAKNGSDVVLSWPGGGTLQQSLNLGGTYTDVTGATSPFTTNTLSTQLFFRVRQ
jgi:hypothetical protein